MANATRKKPLKPTAPASRAKTGQDENADQLTMIRDHFAKDPTMNQKFHTLLSSTEPTFDKVSDVEYTNDKYHKIRQFLGSNDEYETWAYFKLSETKQPEVVIVMDSPDGRPPVEAIDASLHTVSMMFPYRVLRDKPGPYARTQLKNLILYFMLQEKYVERIFVGGIYYLRSLTAAVNAIYREYGRLGGVPDTYKPGEHPEIEQQDPEQNDPPEQNNSDTRGDSLQPVHDILAQVRQLSVSQEPNEHGKNVNGKRPAENMSIRDLDELKKEQEKEDELIEDVKGVYLKLLVRKRARANTIESAMRHKTLGDYEAYFKIDVDDLEDVAEGDEESE